MIDMGRDGTFGQLTMDRNVRPTDSREGTNSLTWDVIEVGRDVTFVTVYPQRRSHIRNRAIYYDRPLDWHLT